MFEAKISDITTVRDALATVSSIVTEGTFSLDENGINLVAMDPASVAMISFNLLSSIFDEYKLDKPTKMTLNIDYFVQILKRATATDKVSFKLSENKLNITMEGTSKRSFSIPLIDEVAKEQKVPELSFKAEVQIEAGVIKDAVHDSAMVSDAVSMLAKENSFSMFAKADSSDARMDLTKDSPSLISIKCEGECKAKYSIDYLDKMIKAAKVADALVIKFATDYPLRMDYKALDKLQLTFILAPRVETE
jgi:proliferating cell nuclear antigen